jgi:hypothetical protein
MMAGRADRIALVQTSEVRLGRSRAGLNALFGSIGYTARGLRVAITSRMTSMQG